MIEQQLAEVIIGESAATRGLRDTVLKIASGRLPVLIVGPTGSGKELVARGLHLASKRTGAFVACNVCALSDGLFESTFFGHVRGAFTGASQDVRGHLADANGGTIFLDEIGGLPRTAQPKLLRALDGYPFRPVGAPCDRVSDFRVVAATNDDLGAMVQSGEFRADLLYRLSGFVVRVPPLSARLCDIPVLAAHLARRSAGRDEGAVSITPEAMALLERHPWPGNVRELSHVIQRARLSACGKVIDASDVQAALESAPDMYRTAMNHATLREQLLATLAATDGDTQAAARRLGLSRPTVYRRLQALGLATPQRRRGRKA